MIPLISRMMYKNKRVELYYLSDCAPKHVDITSFVEKSEDLLTFLNVEIQTFRVEDYIVKGIVFISDWQRTYDSSDKFLGISWLRNQFASKFTIPAASASELIEKLKIEGFIEETNKNLSSGETKTSIALTAKGRYEVAKLNVKVAVTEEKKITNK